MTVFRRSDAGGRRRARSQLVFAASVLVAAACARGSKPAPASLTHANPDGAGGTFALAAGGTGATATGGRGGSNAGEADTAAGAAGEGGAGAPTDDNGRAAAGRSGAGGNESRGGAAGEGAGSAEAGAPGGEERPVPVCSPRLRFGVGTELALSTPDDDLLQGVTPDELTLVFATGSHFYVADRDSADGDFGAPVEVAAGLDFAAVTVSADGLEIVGARTDGFFAVSRPARGEPFSDSPDDADFLPFNAALEGNPTNDVVMEPLLGAGDSLLVYSFVSPSNEGSRPTLFASEWLGQWSFGEALLGEERLWAQGQERRIATGLSSDGLTLFYRDEIAGEFRGAFRPTLGDAFDAFVSLGDLASAAPDGPCARLYYSAASNAGGLDLFVADAL
ncbi:MAG TPA: hypothetical protein VMI54_16520 [Polyangiaceae bacterium]|nr:hypothetical protein [Polyangiaceae bacterium]